MNFNVKMKQLKKNAVLPKYASADAAGCDLYAAIDEPIEIKPFEVVKIDTGIAMALPSGFGGFIYARSGLATKSGLAPANLVGVIDPDYRGSVIVALKNFSKETKTVQPNDRIAQLVITPYATAQFELVDELSETERGSGGFGSTGAN